jgi:hypothetical protein
MLFFKFVETLAVSSQAARNERTPLDEDTDYARRRRDGYLNTLSTGDACPIKNSLKF